MTPPVMARGVRPRKACGRGDLVDQPPAQSRHGGEPVAGEHEPGRAPAADPAHDAHRPARAGDQAHADLGEREERVRRGDKAPRVSRHLGARADAGAVRRYGHLGRDAGDDPPWCPRQPDQVGRHQVIGGAELLQVTAAAKGRARAAQLNRLDRLVGLPDEQRVQQRLPQPRAERVAPCGVIEDDR
jgi:hypothetical protein